jgi:hypothetical protein
MFFSGGMGKLPASLVVITHYFYNREHTINLYDSQTGELKPDYSGLSYAEPSSAPDNSFFAYDLNGTHLVVIHNDAVLMVESGYNINSSNTSFQLVTGNNAVALSESGEHVTLFMLDSDKNLAARIPLTTKRNFSGSLAIQGDWLVFYNSRETFIWNLTAPNDSPRIATISSDYYADPSISADGGRLWYIRNDNQRILSDVATGEILATVPKYAVLSPDWLNISYWEHGDVIVHSLSDKTDTVLNIIPAYEGAVADVNYVGGQAAFSGEAFQVFDLTQPAPTLNPITIPQTDPVPYGGEFIRETGNLVVFSEKIDGRQVFTHWNEYIFAEDVVAGLTYIDYGSRGEFKMSPQGRYIISYSIYCDSVYGAPSLYLRPFVDVDEPLPDGMVWNSQMSFGCGANAVVFVADDSLFYGVEGNRLIRFEPKIRQSSQDEGLYWDTVGLMYYDDYKSSDGFLYRTDSLSLSPDEQSVALYVDYYDSGVYYILKSHAIEVFHLEDLPETLMREDATPALSIPDATSVVFSPDSQMIVTDVGLYSFENGLLSAAIDGGISAFSADSTLLATYQDGYVTLWDVRDDGGADSPIAQYQVNNVRELGFSPDGSRLYVVRDGDVQIWGIQS